MGKLTDREVRAAGPGKHGDGGGLTLIVSDGGAKRWMLRFQMAGKRRDMGMGSYPEIGLADARRIAAEARSLAAKGVDPIAARDADRKASRPIPTFREISKPVIAELQARTSNKVVKYQHNRHLGDVYCGPILDKTVNTITATDVAKMLRP